MIPPAPSYPAEFYVALHRGTPGDLEYYQEQCRGSARVLELGCGDGRVLEALAAQPASLESETAPPWSALGIDHDPEMLELAQKRLKKHPQIELQCGDFLKLRLSHPFDRILLPFCGLYCLADDQQLQTLMQQAAMQLSPNGRFILDSYNADAFHEEAREDLEDGDNDPPTQHPDIEVRGVAYRVFEQSRWQKQAQVIEVSYLHSAIDPAAAQAADLPDELVTSIRHRYLLRAQVQAAAANAGLVIDRAFGAFDKSPWASTSHWSIFELQKAEATPRASR